MVFSGVLTTFGAIFCEDLYTLVQSDFPVLHAFLTDVS